MERHVKRRRNGFIGLLEFDFSGFHFPTRTINLTHMQHLSNLIVLIFFLLFAKANGTSVEAQGIEKSYQTAMNQWAIEMRTATNPMDRMKISDKRPDSANYARQMWAVIGISLNEEWTLEPAAWFLRITSNLYNTDGEGVSKLTFAKENDAIRTAIETKHLKSSKLTPICVALAISPNQRSLAVLEKIQASHPDPRIQGVAALGCAMQLKTLGDDGEIMRKRLTALRMAIIQSSDVNISGTSVAKLAEDELYIIRFLNKGRIAPDLVGIDSANRPISLATNTDKIIVLVFWNTQMQDAKQVIEITNALATKFKGRPLTVIGVNNDPVEKLRVLQAEDTVTWPNFSDPENKLAKEYRIGFWPFVFVLDGDRKIHYAGQPGSFAELTAEALLSEIKPTVEAK